MLECIKNIPLTLETFFESYPFWKDVFTVVLGVILGGFCTVFINRRAIRKECKFNMQYEILHKESECISGICKSLEQLEIGLSFGDGRTAQEKNAINELQVNLCKLNQRLRDERKFVRKFLSAVIVEQSAVYASKYLKALYIIGPKGVSDLKIVDQIDSSRLELLRDLEDDLKNLSNDMADAMEQIIEPGLFYKLKRKFRPAGMFIEDCAALAKVQRQEKSKNKKKQK